MRIALLHNRYREPGGEDVVVEQEAALLREHGHDVRLLLADNRTIDRAGPGLAARTVWSRSSARRVSRFLDEAPVDIMHVHNTFPVLSPSVYSPAQDRGIPVVQTLHNFRLLCPAATLFRDGGICTECPESGSFVPAVRHACYRDSRAASAVVATMLAVHRARGTWHRSVDAFIVLTKFARARFEAGGLSADRLHVRPNFVTDHQEWRAGRRVDGPAVYVGRLSNEKGVHLLMEAWHQVAIPLTVLGDGPLRSELERLAPPNVTFLGRRPRDEVMRIVSDAAFLVMPSICYEGFGMAAVEALSVGVPVIVSELGGLPEIVQDGVVGRCFEPGSARALAAAANELAADEALRERLGDAARRAYLARYTPQAAYERLIEIYGEATARRSSARRAQVSG